MAIHIMSQFHGFTEALLQPKPPSILNLLKTEWMEKLRKVVNEIASSSQKSYNTFTSLHRSLIPLLSVSSFLYKHLLSLRHHLYRLGLFRRHRLPVAVISVGNLTWGGNGKTPMVEYIALRLAEIGLSPLLLTRGYAGGDEANMLRRHLHGTSSKIGVGANRFATAASFLERYGYVSMPWDGVCLNQEKGVHHFPHQIGDRIAAVILDDGMQHFSLYRDLEIAMVNGVMPWGNCQLVPLGPLREPLTALKRADVVVVHHANLVSDQKIREIELTICKVRESLPIFLSEMSPLYFFNVADIKSEISLESIYDRTVLCVSAIGFSNAFVQVIEKLQPSFVDRLDFSDHYLLQSKDIEMIRRRLRYLENEHCSNPIVIVTEKDYDRDPEVLKYLDPYDVFVLCSHLKLIPYKGRTEENFKSIIFNRILKHKEAYG